MYQTPTPSNEPNCPVRISVPQQEKRSTKLAPDDWAQVAAVVGTKELLISRPPQVDLCPEGNVRVPVLGIVHRAHRLAGCGEKSQENSDQKEENSDGCGRAVLLLTT